jgi:hypothetical protein
MSTTCPSRTARVRERSGCARSATSAPDPWVTRKTSGSAVKALSPASGTMPRSPSSLATFVPPAASTSEPMAVPAPAVYGSPQ